MAGKFCTEGHIDLLTWYFPNVQTSRGADALYLGLYTDTTEPSIGAIIGTGLTELALTGYARIQLLDADWTVVDNLASNLMKTFTAGENWGDVYGSFLTNASSGISTLIAVKHFTSGPFNVLDTKTIDVTPKFLMTAS